MNARVVQGEALLYRLIDGNVTSLEVISLRGFGERFTGPNGDAGRCEVPKGLGVVQE